MAYQASGYLHEIFDEQQVSEKYRKREFVLEINTGNYPEHIKFNLAQDKCALVDAFRVGEQLTVHFNLRGRGFNKNGTMLYFTNLEAWRLEALASAPVQGRPAPPRGDSAPIQGPHDEDLPF